MLYHIVLLCPKKMALPTFNVLSDTYRIEYPNMMPLAHGEMQLGGGFVALEWQGAFDQDFIDQLDRELDLTNILSYPVPFVCRGDGEGEETDEMLAHLYGPARREERV